MLVSWEWLSRYVELDVSPEQLANRFALSGLNHDSTQRVGDDWVLDLEVTSNRGDCLGHIGIAREAAVLLGVPLRLPEFKLKESAFPVESTIRVSNRYETGCTQYTARVIRGVKIGKSPEWMARRLEAVGIRPINNVVDATNFVMLECGQPLHAFDHAKLAGGEVIVRAANEKEPFIAIDHRTYQLTQEMIVIADAQRAIALGGVMGGADSEVSDATTDILIEAADFAPLPIRHAARSLRLHSPSSFRFERRVDPSGIDWASRRCCQLILDSAGGELCRGVVDTLADAGIQNVPSFPLRHRRIAQVLGIEVPWKNCLHILTELGCKVSTSSQESANICPPTWRHDMTREIDAIEEIARIHGYEQIPEDVPVPITPSSRRLKDFMLDHVRSLANAIGLDEAMTPSVVGKAASDFLSNWSDENPIRTLTPLLEGATFLRRSLVPSLLHVRAFNQSLSNLSANLFETAVCFLPPTADQKLPHEQVTLGVVCDSDVRHVRGMLESIVHRVAGDVTLAFEELSLPQLAAGTGLTVKLHGKRLAWLGRLNEASTGLWKLDGKVVVSELNLDLLLEHARLIPQLVPIVSFPAIHRDLNLIVDESLNWAGLAKTVEASAGPLLLKCIYRETYRDPKKDGIGKKRVLFSLSLQSATQTLTGDQADELIARVVVACRDKLGAQLLT